MGWFTKKTITKANDSETYEKTESHSPTLDGSTTPAEKNDSDNKHLVDDESQYPSGAKLAAVLMSLALCVFLVSIDQTIVSTAIPKITDEFNALDSIGWIGSAYFLTSTALQPLYGRLYGSFNIKWVYLTSIGIFELGSLICAVAPNAVTLIVGRAIAGVGMAGAYSGSLIIVSVSAPIHKRPLFTSFMGAVYGVGAICGPLIGGAFTSHVSWRWCFYINLPIGAVTVVLIALFFNPRPRPHSMTLLHRLIKVDWLGSVLVMGSIICILLALQWGGIKYEWSSSIIIGLLVGFAVIAIAFAGLQVYLGDAATIPPRILMERTIFLSSMENMMIGGAYFSIIYFLPIYFQAVRDASAISSGVDTLPLIVSVILSVTLSGAAVGGGLPYTPFMIVGNALFAIGSGLLYTLDQNTSTSKWIGYQIVAGWGGGITFMQAYAASQVVLHENDIELGSAVVIFFQTLGGAIFVSVAQAIYQNLYFKGLFAIPGIDPFQIIAVGVTAFRSVVSPEALPAVITEANSAIVKTFLLPAAMSVIGVLFSIFIPIRSVPKAKRGGAMVAA